jgi:DNA polymerase III gamma/tau subunit
LTCAASIRALAAHFKNVADQEGIAIDDESLAMIARAAEGSVRDGLSLLDQAIAHGGGRLMPKRCAPCSALPIAPALSACSAR